MAFSYRDRVVLVTGASSGIGRALALRLAKEGARPALVARRGELLEQLTHEIRAAGGVAAWSAADVAERDALHRAIGDLRQQLGPIDVLIANAGVGTPTLLDPLNIRDVERMFQVNVLGTIYAIEAVLPEMLKRREGRLVAVSSIVSFKGLPGESAYCATKAAVNSYLEGLRIHLRSTGVSATVACPGFVETPMTAMNNFKMPFLLSADQAASEILWAIRKKKKIHRFPRRMSWLMRLVSWSPDWLIARGMKDYNEHPPTGSV